MTYATLMVHVDVDAELDGRVRIARELAGRFGAHLIGVGAWAPMSVFLAEEAKVDPAPSEPHLQDMKTLLDQKGGIFALPSETPIARPNGGQCWISRPTPSRAKRVPPT
jgi:hypothetical protein